MSYIPAVSVNFQSKGTYNVAILYNLHISMSKMIYYDPFLKQRVGSHWGPGGYDLGATTSRHNCSGSCLAQHGGHHHRTNKSFCRHDLKAWFVKLVLLPSFLGQLLWGLVWFFDQWIVAWFHECPYAVCVKKDLPLNDLMWGDKHVMERSTIGLPQDVECFMTMVAMCNEHLIQAPTATAGRPSIKKSSQRFKCFVSNGYVVEVVWVYG